MNEEERRWLVDKQRDERALAAPTPEELERLQQFSLWLATTNEAPVDLTKPRRPHSLWLDKRPGWLNLTAADRRLLRSLRIKAELV